MQRKILFVIFGKNKAEQNSKETTKTVNNYMGERKFNKIVLKNKSRNIIVILWTNYLPCSSSQYHWDV